MPCGYIICEQRVLKWCYIYFFKQRSQTEKSKKEHHKLSEQLNTEKADKKTVSGLKEELEELQQQTEEQEKAVAALKMACKVSNSL